MRKEVNGEKFIQGKDLIFIVDNSILENNYIENNNETEKIKTQIPGSLWSKLFDISYSDNELEKYIKITTEEESKFYDRIVPVILSKNDLDELSLEQLDQLYDTLKQTEALKASERVSSIRKQIKSTGILKYKIDTLLDYKKSRNPNKYLEKLNPNISRYFSILSNEFPDWLVKYINTTEMQRLDKISQNCGTDYTKFCPVVFPYSVLTHSVAVALITWNFTKDKVKTLAGLFHDIATPAFKHTIDFMNGDALTQESTEAYTKKIITESPELMRLLIKDGISVDDVANFKKYSILDNDTHGLCADRLDNTFLPGLANEKIWTFDGIERTYKNIVISKNEYGNDELAFKNQRIAEDYVLNSSKIFKIFMSDNNRTAMQFFADIFNSLISEGYLTYEDFYKLSDKEIMDRILNSRDGYLSTCFTDFLNTTKVYKSKENVVDKYSIKIGSKKRYADPLIIISDSPIRISHISLEAYTAIEEIKNINFDYYTYLDINFTPYKSDLLKEKK